MCRVDSLASSDELLTNILSPDYVIKYATKDAADEAGDASESEDEMSSVGEYDSGDEEPAGPMEV